MVFAIPLAAARVAPVDDVAGGGLLVELVGEEVAVLHLRPTVNLQNRWVLLRRVEAGRLQNPAVQLVAVGGLEPHFFRRVRRHLGQPRVERCQRPRRVGRVAAQVAHADLGRVVGWRPNEGQPRPHPIEGVAAGHAATGHDPLDRQLRGEGVEGYDGLVAAHRRQAEDAPAVGRPDGQGRRGVADHVAGCGRHEVQIERAADVARARAVERSNVERGVLIPAAGLPAAEVSHVLPVGRKGRAELAAGAGDELAHLAATGGDQV